MFQQQEHIEYIRVTSNQVQGQCTRVPQTLPVQHTAGFEKRIRVFPVQSIIFTFHTRY